MDAAAVVAAVVVGAALLLVLVLWQRGRGATREPDDAHPVAAAASHDGEPEEKAKPSSKARGEVGKGRTAAPPVEPQELLTVLKGHRAPVCHIVFTPDGKVGRAWASAAARS
jgi:hypothetical protein